MVVHLYIYFFIRVKSFSVGDKIDVRDPRYIWCEGTVQRIINRYEKKSKYVVIHYEVFSFIIKNNVFLAIKKIFLRDYLINMMKKFQNIRKDSLH